MARGKVQGFVERGGQRVVTNNSQSSTTPPLARTSSASFLTCTQTAQTGETGTSERIAKFRALKCAQSYGIAQLTGATIVP